MDEDATRHRFGQRCFNLFPVKTENYDFDALLSVINRVDQRHDTVAWLH
jgi:hypothetical protein